MIPCFPAAVTRAPSDPCRHDSDHAHLLCPHECAGLAPAWNPPVTLLCSEMEPPRAGGQRTRGALPQPGGPRDMSLLGGPALPFLPRPGLAEGGGSSRAERGAGPSLLYWLRVPPNHIPPNPTSQWDLSRNQQQMPG